MPENNALNNSDSAKHAVDLLAASVTITALMEWVPAVTAVFSLIWVLIRIWETETVKGITGR